MIRKVIKVLDMMTKFREFMSSLKLFIMILYVLAKEGIDIARESYKKIMMEIGLKGDGYTCEICLTNRIGDGFKLLQKMKNHGVKVLMPHRIFLLRGNHELKYCTSVYAFEKEVYVNYGDNGKHVYRKSSECFEGLPLASIIAGQVYTAHGGLFRGTVITPSKRSKKKNRKVVHNPEVKSLTLGSLEELAKARRSVLDPPWEGSNLIPGDVLWSDPSINPGLSPNSERGICLLFGPDCAEEFLEKYNLMGGQFVVEYSKYEP